MDTPDGLAVPNIKNCQKKSIWEIAMEMNKLMERGKARQFTKDDLSDGTFSISNIGSVRNNKLFKKLA
jgi:pyruvate/2-oxoglutarate dehydrogenase complex dihydrolipoamide acyltransferase (E2) component